MDNSCKQYIYICPNCGEEYYFYGEVTELQCEIYSAMVVKDG